jgi:hypothetical protein
MIVGVEGALLPGFLCRLEANVELKLDLEFKPATALLAPSAARSEVCLNVHDSSSSCRLIPVVPR